jgi:hypothetical protein
MYIVGKGTPPPNRAPDAPANPVPLNGAAGIETSPTLSVYAYDPDGDTMTINFYSNGELIGTDTDVISGSTASIIWEDLIHETVYEWYAVAEDEEYLSQSETWHFTTGGEVQSGSMYVADISWVSLGVNLNSYVTIRWDSNGDGSADAGDQPVTGATVFYKLTYLPTGISREYEETTDADGQIIIQWKKAPFGLYTGNVTDLTSATLAYNRELDQDNPDFYTH